MFEFGRANAQNVNTATTRSKKMDVGLRIYMLKVYNYMSVGLLVTALFAYVGAASGIYQQIAGTPFIWVLMLAPLGMVIWLSARINKMSSFAARNLFFIFAALMGLSLSYVLLAYTGTSVTTTFLVTAASFGALSLYGYTTGRDLSGFGSFLIMGVVGILIASLVNWFLQSSGLHFVISVGGVLIFAGLTAYDTQMIKRMYYGTDTREVAEKKAVFGALRLYLDFINLFLFLLNFLGNRR